MKIAISGYGKMGRSIHEIAELQGHRVVTIVNNNEDLNKLSVKDVDVCIDFSNFNVALNNIEKFADLGIPIVSGTTGISNVEEKFKDISNRYSIPIVYSSNFSIGVFLFNKIINYSSKLIDKFDQYDISCHEIHHKNKKDIPSGTAKNIIDTILNNVKRKKNCVIGNINGIIKDSEIHCSSQRVGKFVGTHSVLFDSDIDTLKIEHIAKNRDGFSSGALLSAEWVINKIPGLYNINDVIGDIL